MTGQSDTDAFPLSAYPLSIFTLFAASVATLLCAFLSFAAVISVLIRPFCSYEIESGSFIGTLHVASCSPSWLYSVVGGGLGSFMLIIVCIPLFVLSPVYWTRYNEKEPASRNANRMSILYGRFMLTLSALSIVAVGLFVLLGIIIHPSVEPGVYWKSG